MSSRIFLLGVIVALALGSFVAYRLKTNEIALDVLAIEDLMREHGALNRLLLIYEAVEGKLNVGTSVKKDIIYDSAYLIKTFIEEYHEKLEEEYIFPVLATHPPFKDLVATLKAQHEAGRLMTHYILEHAQDGQGSYDAQRKLASMMRLFIRMYRPHEAREDTELFPAIHKMMSPQDYLAMSDIFEDRETALFGKNGFQAIVTSIARIETLLGINDLAQFTPDARSIMY